MERFALRNWQTQPTKPIGEGSAGHTTPGHTARRAHNAGIGFCGALFNSHALRVIERDFRALDSLSLDRGLLVDDRDRRELDEADRLRS